MYRAVNSQADFFRTRRSRYAIFYSCRHFCGGDCTQHFGVCKVAADWAVADMAQVEFDDFVAGEAECLGEVLGAVFEAQDNGFAQLVDGFFAFFFGYGK